MSSVGAVNIMLELALFLATINNGSMASVGKKPKKIGKLKQNGVRLEPHEKRTVDFLRKKGHNIELIPPSNIPKAKTPDMMMDGTEWEMKSPTTSNEKTIERMFLRGLKQSNKIIFDLRFVKKDSDKIARYLEKLFRQTRSIRSLIIIRENKEAFYKKM